MKTSQYKDLKFKDKAKLQKWLKEKTKYEVTLEDCGQDFLEFWIDEHGEILDCQPFQGWLWIGKMVNTKSIKRGQRIRFIDGGELNYRTIHLITWNRRTQ